MGVMDELLKEEGETSQPVAEATPAVSPPDTPAATSPEAPVVEQTPAAVTPPAAPVPAASAPQDHSVPLNVLLRTREEFGGKLSQAEQRALAAEAKLAEIDRKAKESAQAIPHPLDDPDGFAHGVQSYAQRLVEQAIGDLDSRRIADRNEISRVMVEQHLGGEKFAELEKFIEAAPDNAHAVALQQAHPYGWFLQRFNDWKAQQAAQATLKQLDGRSIDDIVAERVAAERAKWEAEHTQPPPAVADAPARSDRARNADGTFAPSPEPQRNRPPSLAAVNGAHVAANQAADSDYFESEFKTRR